MIVKLSVVARVVAFLAVPDSGKKVEHRLLGQSLVTINRTADHGVCPLFASKIVQKAPTPQTWPRKSLASLLK